MHYLRIPLFAVAAVLATTLATGASAQSIGGPGGTCFAFSGAGGTVRCRVVANGSLTTSNVLYVTLTSPITAAAQCNGRTGAGYSTQGSSATVPPPVGGTGCEFMTTSGTVSSGSSVGDIVFNLPSAGQGAALQFTTELCAEPTCTMPPGTVTTASATIRTGAGYAFDCGYNGYGSPSYGYGSPTFGYGGGYGQQCQNQGGQCQFGPLTPSYNPLTPNYNYGNQSCFSGAYPCTGQACGGYGYTLCNGVEIPNSGFCTTSNGFTTCPNGQQVPVGALCTSVTGSAVTYPAGWNLIGGPPGAIPTSSTVLYYLPPGSNGYQTLPAGTAMQPGVGYWAYFPSATTTTLPSGGNGSVTVTLPAGQFITIGNPSDGPATVSGPAGLVVLVANPGAGGYTQTTQLAAGQGGWAALPSGGTITITGSGGGYGPFSPPPPPPPLP
jgi:hypothetical protein